jgi:hypothetical protein
VCENHLFFSARDDVTFSDSMGIEIGICAPPLACNKSGGRFMPHRRKSHLLEVPKSRHQRMSWVILEVRCAESYFPGEASQRVPTPRFPCTENPHSPLSAPAIKPN